jgi:hypothetical protein
MEDNRNSISFPSESEYRAVKAISQSSLGYLAKHPKYFRHKMFVKDEARKDYFVVGSALDTLLTNRDEFDDLYIEEPEYTPPGKMLKLCQTFVKQFDENKCDENLAFDMAYNESGYVASVDSIRRKFEEPGVQLYVRFLREAKGKTLLKKQEVITVRHMAKLLTKSEHCGWIFNKDTRPEHITVLFQVPLFFMCEEVNCKGLLDIVVIDHDKKTIQIIDLKTTGKSVYDFRKSFVSFYYYIQAAFYSRGMQIWKKEFTQLGDISEYEVLNFKFLVQEKACYNKPMFYTTSDNDLRVGKLGGYLNNSERYCKGYIELLDELKWHRKMDYWEMPKEVYTRNFETKLDVFRSN